jgi:hypothetical protein
MDSDSQRGWCWVGGRGGEPGGGRAALSVHGSWKCNLQARIWRLVCRELKGVVGRNGRRYLISWTSPEEESTGGSSASVMPFPPASSTLTAAQSYCLLPQPVEHGARQPISLRAEGHPTKQQQCKCALPHLYGAARVCPGKVVMECLPPATQCMLCCQLCCSPSASGRRCCLCGTTSTDTGDAVGFNGASSLAPGATASSAWNRATATRRGPAASGPSYIGAAVDAVVLRGMQ